MKAKPAKFLSREEVEHTTVEVLKQHGLYALPINPVVLAHRLGIKVNNAKFSDDGMVGMVAKRGDLATILVNFEDPPNRKRFTIAHEIGHHVLHLHEDGEFTDSEANLFRSQEGGKEPVDSDRRLEVQANMFAAALLMPEALIKEFWPMLRSVSRMAELFNVSEEAMGYRLSSLGLPNE